MKRMFVKKWLMQRVLLALLVVILVAMSGVLAPQVQAQAAQNEAQQTGGASSIAGTATEEEVDQGVKALSGMSVLGNNEAPKSLVIVPWKSSELGDGLGIDNLLDERARPVDKEVFKRELSYYRLRTTETEQ